MAVVPRKRRGGVITYYVATSWEGGQHWERVGHNKREAEQVNRDRLKQVKDGSFKPGRLTDAASVESYAKAWLKTRTNRARDNDEQLLTDHVLSVRSFAELRMGEVRPRHVLQLITDIRSAGKLAEKTIALALGLVRVLFRDAVIDETIQATPYVVPRGKLTRAGKTRSPYTPSEVAKLTSSLVPERDRMWALLALLTGCRCGEVCGLTWGDLDEAPVPLAALKVERQYDGAVTKTGRSRVVPVHPSLHINLVAWRIRWSLHFLRTPQPTDPIVPALDGTPMTKSSAYKGWRRACKAAGVTNRTVHSTRHTFITLTRRGGADISIVERITHNPKGTIIDVYNHRDWADFCAAVLCLQIGDPNGSTNNQRKEHDPGAPGPGRAPDPVLHLRTPAGAPAGRVTPDRGAGQGDGREAPVEPGNDSGTAEAFGGEGLLRPGQAGEIDELIERSSLGEPAARLLRQQAPRELVERVLARADELSSLSQSLDVDTREPVIASSSSRTRTVATGCPDLGSVVRVDQRGQVERARAAGLLGVREPLGAEQGLTKTDASLPGSASRERQPERESGAEFGRQTRTIRVAPSGADSGQPYSRAALSLFAEACELGVA